MTDKKDTSPRPWRVEARETKAVIWAADGQTAVGSCHELVDAALIVRAVNAHDDLVAALRPFKALFERIGGEGRSADTTITFKAVDVAPFYAAARDALKKAGAL